MRQRINGNKEKNIRTTKINDTKSLEKLRLSSTGEIATPPKRHPLSTKISFKLISMMSFLNSLLTEFD
jgi:hypothetical protein